ncbi:MAG: CoA pyrophosphatase [Dehalococcoidales bacterium]|nr:CoA pyrophosphatase [Dehalococcoidales bacterium]
MIEKLRETLAERQILRISDSGLKPSSVLVPVFMKEKQYYLLFIQRTDRVKAHKGQVSFPGGAYEKADGTLLNTALREAYEEIGLEPTDIAILGRLDDAVTAAGYIISPFIGLIPYPYQFKLDKWETEETLEVPLTVLLDKSNGKEGSVTIDGNKFDTYIYRHGKKIIWGATARILKQFLGIIAGL